MKVLYLVHQFYPEYYTGTERFVLNLATMMQKSGHRVKVLTYSFYDDSFYDQIEGNLCFKQFTYQGVPVLAFKYKQIPVDIHSSLENGELSQVAKDLLSREKADLVHVAHTMRVGALAAALPSLEIPYIVTLTDFFLICPKYTLYTSKNTLCNGPDGGTACLAFCPEFQNHFITKRLATAHALLANAKVVVSPSHFLRNMMKLEFQDLPVEIIGYGVRYSTIKKNSRKRAKGDELVFSYAGSLNHHKGVHILIDAFKNVIGSNCVLNIYGSGAEQDYVNELIAMAQEDPRIRFLGVFPGEKVGEILAATDVIVVPSIWYENAPLVLREAIACGVPVIASDAGGMAENIKNGVNGFVFQMGNSGHLKEVIQAIANEPAILTDVKAELNRTIIPAVEQEAFAYARIYARMLAE